MNSNITVLRRGLLGMLSVVAFGYGFADDFHRERNHSWTVGSPIVTYWAGPAMTDATAKQMAEGGWNVVWCTESELDIVRRHGLRAQLHDSLITPVSLDHPEQRAKLDALIDRVRPHPALYAYYLTDEPNTTNFAGLGKLVSYLRERDPAHLAYINLFPTYASNEQLGTQGDVVQAYQEHLRQYLYVVKPALISYDHYQFSVQGDNGQYFLNLALIRRAAIDAEVPFLNIVQACTWTPSMRIPNGNEMRYLVYTTAAYGAQGISYYVYSHPGHQGMIANADGTPTELYHALKVLNREFSALAAQVQPLQSLGVYHAGMLPPGTEPLPDKAPFRLESPLPVQEYKAPQPVQGILFSYFGRPKRNAQFGRPTHVLVVNLDYRADASIKLIGPRRIDVFDAATGLWSSTGSKRVDLRLPPGGGKLVRTKR